MRTNTRPGPRPVPRPGPRPVAKPAGNRLWSRLFERSDIGGADDEARNEADLIRPTTTRYAPIREAVERRMVAFLRQDVVSHLEIGFNEVFLLHYIEVGADRQGAEELAQFLREFSPDARVQWVKKLLGPAVGQHVSLEQFQGLDREFAPEKLAETDPFEEKLNQATIAPYSVILHGRWESGFAHENAREAQPAASEEVREEGPGVRLSVLDGKGSGPRLIEIAQFPAVLGSSLQADVEISGYYVSARHCTVHWEGEQLWLADHSTNGTWVDGERLRRGTRIAIANGSLLGFGRDKGEGDHERYPAVSLLLMRNPLSDNASATPVAPSSSTPIAPGIATQRHIPAAGESAPLAVLAILDATGSPKRDVLKLPYTIGRGSAQDYVVPDANQGVSREHLVIEEIDRSGAVTLNRAVGRNGTFAGNQALPERFLWRFGEEIALGEKWAGAPVVRLSLQNVEPQA